MKKIVAKKVIKISNQVDLFKFCIHGGLNYVLKNSKSIDEINVYPIPDGDTGANLSSTLINGWSSISNTNFETPKQLFTKFSKGLLMGAKGNSGIIFTQILKGFANGLSKNNNITKEDIISGFESAKISAYNSVSNPAEGTILSLVKCLAKISSKKIKKMESDDLHDILKIVVADLNLALENTKNQLQILKKANVVDSGGYGLLCFFEGMCFAAENIIISDESIKKSNRILVTNVDHVSRINYSNTMLGYCTEFIVQLFDENFNVSKPKIYTAFEKIKCNSIVVVKDDELLKIHLHSFHPYKALKIAQEFGEFLKIKVDNMTIQNNHFQEVIDTDSSKKLENRTAIVIITSGIGWLKQFKKLNVDEILHYEVKSKSPNFQDVAKAIRETYCKNVIVVVNSPSITLQVYDAIKLCKQYKQKCKLVKCKNNGEAYVATLNFPTTLLPLDQTIKLMNEAVKNTKVYRFKMAQKTEVINNVNIKESYYVKCYNNKVVSCNKSLEFLLKETINNNVTENTELVTIFNENKYNILITEKVQEYISEKYPMIEVEVLDGLEYLYNYTLVFE